MNLHDIMEPIVLGAIGAAASEAPGDEERIDNFVLDDQDRDNWCWAAVAVSVARQQSSPIVMTQCRLVELALPCMDCSNALCDMPGAVAQALDQYGITVQQGATAAPDIDIVRGALKKKKPVICRVRQEPNEPTALPHVVVIVRGHRPTATVTVRDPGKSHPFEQVWNLASFATHCVDYFLLS